jgi:vacuolar-type H+-ATPase subunit H
MNIHGAIERLEQVITHSRSVPFTRSVLVDQEEVLELVDTLRLKLPEEVKQARWTVLEQQRLLSEAQVEASRILSHAAERAEKMVSQQEMVKRAQRESQAILKDANERAEEIRRAADSYAWEVMHQLESHLGRSLNAVRRGIEALRKPGTVERDRVMTR